MTEENYRENNPDKYKLSDGTIITDSDYNTLLKSFTATYNTMTNENTGYVTDVEKRNLNALLHSFEEIGSMNLAMEFDKESRFLAYTHWNSQENKFDVNHRNPPEKWFEKSSHQLAQEQEKEEIKTTIAMNNIAEEIEENKKNALRYHTENILQLNRSIGQLKDNFSGQESQVALNNLNNYAEQITNSDSPVKADDFLQSIQNIMHVDEEKSKTVRHYTDDNQNNLRISNHSANAVHAKFRPNETSIVIKLSSTKFKTDKDSYLVEYVYESKNLTKEKQIGIINGLKDWINTGDFTDIQFDKEFYSPSKERYLENKNEMKTKQLQTLSTRLSEKDKELDIWISKAEADNKKISRLNSQLEAANNTIQKLEKQNKEQDELLNGKGSVKVNGVERTFDKGLKHAFPEAVKRIDIENQRNKELTADYNNLIKSQNQDISPKSPEDDSSWSD